MRKPLLVPLLLVLLAGCTKDLGVNLDQADQLKLTLPEVQPTDAGKKLLVSYDRRERDDFTLLWMAKSDEICGAYKAQIVQVSRDSRLASGMLATVLGGLATVFTPLGTVRALAGAASIANGTGAVFQSDTFNGQVGEILTAAIETARRNQANQIKNNLQQRDIGQYRLFDALRDVIDYHQMCSLNTALIQVRVSLQTTQPDGGLTAPALQGRQAPGGISPEARAEVDRSGLRNSLNQPRPPDLGRGVQRPVIPGEPTARLTIEDMQRLRPILSTFATRPLNVGNAERPNDPAFRRAVTGFQHCTGQRETGFLTERERIAALSGSDACAPPTLPGGNTPQGSTP